MRRTKWNEVRRMNDRWSEGPSVTDNLFGQVPESSRKQAAIPWLSERVARNMMKFKPGSERNSRRRRELSERTRRDKRKYGIYEWMSRRDRSRGTRDYRWWPSVTRRAKRVTRVPVGAKRRMSTDKIIKDDEWCWIIGPNGGRFDYCRGKARTKEKLAQIKSGRKIVLLRFM